MKTRAEQLAALSRLLEIMDELREKCPWDRKQTFASLHHLTIEETYELGDAILHDDLNEIKKELGDLLLHIIFYAKIGSEKRAFDIGDVADQIAEKLIHRHPHIYGDMEVKDSEEVKKNWEALKLQEGKKSVLEGVPKSLPALVKAQRIQDKAKGVGFDWKKTEDVLEKLKEEIHELQVAISEAKPKDVEAEFGDVFFSLINYARFVGIHPETALEKTNQKFISRFQFIEEKAKENKQSITDLSLDEMEAYWQKAKVFYSSDGDDSTS